MCCYRKVISGYMGNGRYEVWSEAGLLLPPQSIFLQQHIHRCFIHFILQQLADSNYFVIEWRCDFYPFLITFSVVECLRDLHYSRIIATFYNMHYLTCTGKQPSVSFFVESFSFPNGYVWQLGILNFCSLICG